MRLSEFPNCCGIHVIHHFEENNPKEYQLFYEQDPVERLRECEEQHHNHRAGLLLVALADYQWRGWGPFLKKHGYNVLDQFKNPRHGSRIRLYYKKTPQNWIFG